MHQPMRCGMRPHGMFPREHAIDSATPMKGMLPGLSSHLGQLGVDVPHAKAVKVTYPDPLLHTLRHALDGLQRRRRLRKDVWSSAWLISPSHHGPLLNCTGCDRGSRDIERRDCFGYSRQKHICNSWPYVAYHLKGLYHMILVVFKNLVGGQLLHHNPPQCH